MNHPDPGLRLLLHHMMPASESDKPRYVRLYYELKDIHGLCARLRGEGFFVSDPEPTNYGATTAHLDGPDVYTIYFQQWNGRTAGG